mmetsp:Transcript_12867/g.23127  ORF Transcript_12867/g.23127 Transcript_12867/m.23127 type:complete len:80 (-) Transcript_12867:155-394(-)
MFVVDADGKMKTLSKRHWLNSIRLVNNDETCSNSRRRNSTKKQSEEVGSDGKSSKVQTEERQDGSAASDNAKSKVIYGC